MNKFIYGIFFLFITLNAQAQSLPALLRSAKIPRQSSWSATLKRQLFHLTASTPKGPVYRLPISLQTPLTPTQALETSLHLLQQTSLQTYTFKTPSLAPIEQNLSRFLFTIAPAHKPSQILGTGFVFATHLNGQAQLWGATTQDVIQKSGPNLTITFHTQEPKNFSFPATVLLQNANSQAVLLRIPQTASEVALPISIDAQMPQPEQNLIAYGISSNGNFYKAGHYLVFSGSERLFAKSTLLNFPSLTSGGFLLNEQGQAVGLYKTVHPSKNLPYKDLKHTLATQEDFLPTMMSEIIPARHLMYLIKEYQEPASASRVLLLNGKWLGKLAIDEKITAIYTTYADQPIKKWEVSPVWSLDDLGKFIDLKDAQKVIVVIAKSDNTQYTYTLELSSGTVTQIPLNRFHTIK